ncbi:hypothetical protein [Streptosporangium jomthongense]|uniref:Uncharacterized protein n=1 Tax=Streptosporangium jomthongense TaxID=1193683 RepID=A0ABV8FCM9_9ACTN
MAIVNVAAIDARFRLCGDEDCGVGLHCRDCETGGRPVAYYAGLYAVYEDDPTVENVTSLFGLLAAADGHERTVHGGEPVDPHDRPDERSG